MAVRLGLGLSSGTPLLVGTALVPVALATWLAGFTVVGVVLLAVGLAVLLDRRRSSRSLSKDS